MGTNEFEEAWLDEGFNSYHDEKAAQIALGPEGWATALLRDARQLAAAAARPWPVVAPGVRLGRGDAEVAALRRAGAKRRDGAPALGIPRRATPTR